jgi:hypothetical protein
LRPLAHAVPSSRPRLSCRSSLKYGSASHKNTGDETWLLRFYYSFPYALFFVCLFNETFLAMLYLIAYQSNTATPAAAHTVFATQLSVGGWTMSVAELLARISFPVFALKQVISVVQLVTAAQRIVAIDTQAIAAAPATTKAATKAPAKEAVASPASSASSTSTKSTPARGRSVGRPRASSKSA